jgi:hypothetical protein
MGMSAAAKTETAKANLAMQSANFAQSAVNEAAKYDHSVTRSVSKAIDMKPPRDLTSDDIKKIAKQEESVLKLQNLEANMEKLAGSKEIGGRWNALVDEFKEFAGLQGDLAKQETWKEYMMTLTKERSEIFGASLTESERKAFEQAVTTWHSKPEMLVQAIRNIRRNTENLYKREIDLLQQGKFAVPTSGISLKVDEEQTKKQGGFKAQPSIK